MSGGRIVVLDRVGRETKRFPLADGLATLGSDPACDIRIMLPTVSPHHATVVVHANQTVVRNVCDGETLVNGRCVSVAALRHGDVIGIGGRQLRWDYADPTVRRPQAPEPALYVGRRTGRAGRRGGSAVGAAGAGLGGGRDPAVQLALEMTHRASMPGSAGGKQVAIVQPQRRDTNDQIDKYPPRTPVQANKRPRTSKSDLDTSINDTENEKTKRKSGLALRLLRLDKNTTKATLWIESRKSSPRKSNKTQTPIQEQAVKVRRNTASAKKSTPLRLTVLKRAQSAQKMKVTKIEAPLKIDHTKQAALLLMTGHSPKSKVSPAAPPSLLVKKGRPPRPPRTPRTPRSSQASTVTILDTTDSTGRNSTLRNSSALRRSGHKSSKKSTEPASPRKSALKDPSAKRGTRKTESIKFDLSNLENHSQDTEILMVSDTTKLLYDGDSASEDEITLRYSESSEILSPSPRRSIHSRSNRMLEKSLGRTLTLSPPSRTLTPESPRPRRSVRGSIILHKALNDTKTPSYSSRTTKSVSDVSSKNTTVASAYRTRTLSPRTPRNELESYSIVDLVSIDTDESGRSSSVYDSAGGTDSTTFGTPQNSMGRKTRSTIDPTLLLGSSTPYVKGSKTSTTRLRSSSNTSSKTSINGSQSTTRSSTSRRSKSLSTPENTENVKKHISVNSTKISRASRSRSRINDSDLLLVDDDDDSPRTSKRSSTTSKSTRSSAPIVGSSSINASPTNSPAQNEGMSTPENRHSPEEATTPVLSIQSLLDSSQSSLVSQRSSRKVRPSFNAKRKTIGVVTSPKTRIGTKSKSMNFSARKTRLRLSSESVEASDQISNSRQQGNKIVTPKSAVKLIQEGVKNKHSTEKKPQSKRSIIDDLNESDIVKQLFNSPVKRKLSQSMTEFSRKQLFDDDEIVKTKRATRNTIALTGRTPDNSLLDHTEAYTPEMFVSPISTPTNSPNLAGIKLLFAKNTPENVLRNVRGVKGLLRTPRTRRSIHNDLTNVAGVKNIFAKSPKNRLSDVRVKEVFASSPKNDLRDISGVKSLFQSTKKRKSPRNELNDVRGVKKLFKTKSPANDLRNVSGVKRTLRRNSPKNDLSDVRGVRRMFRQEKQRNDLNDVSGVEELFNLSNQSHRDSESLFDQLIGKPPIKAVYSKTFFSKTAHKSKDRKAKSLHESLEVITNNVEGWLEQELEKRLHKSKEQASTSKSANKSKSNMTRELQKLVTETVEGNEPIRTSRARNSTIIRVDGSDIGQKKSASELYSPHTLPIKKRSLVEASMEKVKNDSKINNLPIKKRVVVHSTPVKGKINLTMNASVLGRVSPIAAVDDTRHLEHETSIRSNQHQKETTEVHNQRPKSRRGTKSKIDNVNKSNALEFVKPSPKKTRGKAKVVSPPTAKSASSAKEKASEFKAQKTSPANTKTVSPAKANKVSPTKNIQIGNLTKPNTVSPAKIVSPVQVRATRSRKKDVSIPESNTKKRGATLVVAKKSPVISPKPDVSRKRKEPESLLSPKPSPKKTRANRKQDIVNNDMPKTPKNTRAKVQKATVVISKPSPQLKPRAAKTRGQTGQSQPNNTKKTRKTVIVEEKLESPKKSQDKGKSSSKTQASEVPSARKTRGRNTKVINESKEKVAAVEKSEVRTKRGRKTVDDVVDTKTRNTKQEKSIEQPKPVRTRGKKIDVQENSQSEPTTRSRRATKQEVTPDVKNRKRKAAAPDNEIPPKVSKPKDVAVRGRKQTAEAKTVTQNVRKKSVVKEAKVVNAGRTDVPVKVTRGKKVAEVKSVKASEKKTPELDQKTLRGRKPNIENVPVKSDTGKRKRAAAANSPPVEEPRKKARGSNTRSNNKSGVTSPARATRRNIATEASKPAGRSRRR